jgi:hypothetical protein
MGLAAILGPTFTNCVENSAAPLEPAEVTTP